MFEKHQGRQLAPKCCSFRQESQKVSGQKDRMNCLESLTFYNSNKNAFGRNCFLVV